MTAALSLRGLTVGFSTENGKVAAVRGVDLDVPAGGALAVVGESGSGKTQTFMAVMGLLAANAHTGGTASLADGTDLLGMPRADLDRVRGNALGMVFQDPMSSLHPAMRVGRQLVEGYRRHRGCGKAEARERAERMLVTVGVPEPRARLDAYPHQLSGGLRQRVMIAMALMCEPQVLIADEPTTALDVTIQAQVLDLFARLREEMGMALVLITHDLAVVARLCDSMAVMYAGQVVETGPAAQLLAAPSHPYTLGLLHATPRDDAGGGPLAAIPGQPPDMLAPPAGCAFQPRCPFATAACAVAPPLAPHGERRQRACHVPPPAAADAALFREQEIAG